MNRQSSPFAALTGKEQLERWREFQTIRLPYINGSVDAEPPAEAPREQAPAPKEPPPEKPRMPESSRIPENPERSSFQTTRHQQYDAVVQRMLAASRKATRFEPVR